jgi:hypothetical protein
MASADVPEKVTPAMAKVYVASSTGPGGATSLVPRVRDRFFVPEPQVDEHGVKADQSVQTQKSCAPQGCVMQGTTSRLSSGKHAAP